MDTESTNRYTKGGRRRGKHRYAAPLGAFITLLSLVGIAAIVCGIVAGVRKATDTTALKEEMYYFLEPLMLYNPTPFDGIEDQEQDAFLNAAAYKISKAEQVRMLRENDENCRYAVDDQGRIAVSVEEMEQAYNALFGPSSPLTHRSLEESGLVFSAGDNCYYVPFESLVSGYQGVVDYVKRRGDTYTVRVGYVSNKDIPLDEHGNAVPATVSMAAYFQTYTVVRYTDGYFVNGCADQ